MSNQSELNPYLPANFGTDQRTGKLPLQGYAKVACIFFIILGSIGLLQTMGTFASLAINAVVPQPGQPDVNNIFPGAIVFAIAFALINFGVSIVEILGGILGLKQQRKGANLIRNTSVFMLVFKVVETVYGVVVGFVFMGEIKAQMLESMDKQPNRPEMDMGWVLDIGLYVGFGFAIAFGLIMFLFYLFTFLHFSKPATMAQFS
jgi:hypothetical protein